MKKHIFYLASKGVFMLDSAYCVQFFYLVNIFYFLFKMDDLPDLISSKESRKIKVRGGMQNLDDLNQIMNRSSEKDDLSGNGVEVKWFCEIVVAKMKKF